MINKFPYFPFKITTLWALIFMFASCSKREEFVFEKQIFETATYLDCNPVDCAIIEIRLVQLLNDTKVGNQINRTLETKACEFLTIEENSTTTSIETAMISFNKLYTDIVEAFPEETPPYEALLDSEVQFQNAQLASVLLNTYSFTGGAHGNTTTMLLNFDLSTGRLISIDNLVKDTKAFSQYVEKKFRSTYTIPSQKGINSTGFSFDNDQFSLPEHIGFTNNEIILHYNHYEISSYADGPVVLKIDKAEAADYFDFNILE
ncbi:DUF3298 and DUF4163 domain-containing protein [Aquimarina intermedia]|uniref:Uncharacterized protein DUF3298 n=1 Tax=Aquimarina intermedia TaxID=350814 RepID=A0A5S5CC43_9FLAO|nr:DUF3298 and DUF4163 domain-containing protein [Aquimarina intermedia]TYP76218.1 uncharacterized protein DUF3298 [Aquimarina intermedia]